MFVKALFFIMMPLLGDGLDINKATDMYIMDVSNIKSVRFELFACKDVHFLLYNEHLDLVRVIVLDAADLCSIRRTFSEYIAWVTCLLTCEWNKVIWMSWESDFVRLGYGDLGQNVLLSSQSPDPLNIKYLSHFKVKTSAAWKIRYIGMNMEDTSEKQYKWYVRTKDTRSGSVLSVETTRSRISCSTLCSGTAGCFGFNFNRVRNSTNNCELLSSNHTPFTIPPPPLMNFQSKIGWDFYIETLNMAK